MKVCVTGVGVVSALGVGRQATVEALRAGVSAVAPAHFLTSIPKTFPVGEVPMSNADMEAALGLAPEAAPRSVLLGMMALGEALGHAGLHGTVLHQAGFVSATTVGGMDKSEQYYRDFLSNDSRDAFIRTHDCGTCTEMVAAHFGSFAFATTLSTSCSSAANAAILGANLLRSGRCQCVVVGGTECLTRFHFNGFNALMILDRRPCRPFSPDRAGLNLGEGAGYLVLETEAHALGRGVQPLAYLAGYGNACDAHHQTATSPDGEGACRAMRAAVSMAGCPEVDYINAHGTGTPDNDASEARAIERLFGTRLPALSSTKSMTGHTTSASGAVEAVFCILALQHQFLPALRCEDGTSLLCDALTAPQDWTERCPSHPLRTVLCNAFGFGGNDSSLLFSLGPLPAAAQAVSFVDEDGMAVADNGKSFVYLSAVNHISSQPPLSDAWLTQPVVPTAPYTRAVEPDYKSYVTPLEGRRMGPLLKRALAVSKAVLSEGGVAQPDAVVTGTGLGCIDSTERFLAALCGDDEPYLKPTHFIQSTHNTIGSTLAIQTHNHAYNATYAHKGLSFESALLDAVVQIGEGRIATALVGGHDEMTPTCYRLLSKAGLVGHHGVVASEAAVAALLSNSPDHAVCRIAVCLLGHVGTMDAMRKWTALFPEEHLYVMTGMNGDPHNDGRYLEDCATLFPGAPLLCFKPLFGTCHSASALGFYAAAKCLEKGVIPASLAVRRQETSAFAAPRAIALYNRCDSGYCSLVLLCRADDDRPCILDNVDGDVVRGC